MVSHDLDRKSKRILEAVYNHGGEAESGEIKEYTGIDDNGKLHYRINKKLEPAGLVETRTIEDGDRRLGVKVTELTDDGQRVVGNIFDEDGGPTLADRMEMLESDFEDLRESVLEYQGQTAEAIEKGERFEELALEAEAALDRIEVLDEHIEELRRRVDHVEDHPFEDVVEKKMAELRKVTAKVENADAMNADVRRALRQNGVIQGTRKPVTRADVPESEYDWLDKQKNSPVRNTPQRDAYEAGPMIDVVAEGTDQLEAEITDAVIPEETAEKLIALDEAGLLDDILDQVAEIAVEADETAAAINSNGGDGGD